MQRTGDTDLGAFPKGSKSENSYRAQAPILRAEGIKLKQWEACTEGPQEAFSGGRSSLKGSPSICCHSVRPHRSPPRKG